MHDDSSTAKYLWLRIVLCETECESTGMSPQHNQWPVILLTGKKKAEYDQDSVKSYQEQRYVSMCYLHAVAWILLHVVY